MCFTSDDLLLVKKLYKKRGDYRRNSITINEIELVVWSAIFSAVVPADKIQRVEAAGRWDRKLLILENKIYVIP